MLGTDHPVWFRFLEKWGEGFLRLYYDCLLGGPTLTEAQEKDPMQRMWRANTAKRADAIAELEDAVWIIEVAERPGLRAVGQLQVYRALWLEDIKIFKPEKLILVVHFIDTDLLASAAKLGIEIYPV